MDFFWSYLDKFKSTDSKIIITGKKLQGMHSTRLEYSTNFFCRPAPDQEAELCGGKHLPAQRGTHP